MASKESLRSDNRRYENLINQLRTTADRLYKASNDAGKISSTLERVYTINNNSVNAIGRTNRLAANIMGKRDYIYETVIPAINYQIEQNNAQIRRIEEEEERQRREAEARAREAERKANESKLAAQSRRS